jgi:hypothetical protein
MSRVGVKSSACRGLRDGPGAAFLTVVEKHRATRDVRTNGFKALSMFTRYRDEIKHEQGEVQHISNFGRAPILCKRCG